MQNYNKKNDEHTDINECTTRATCSVSPTIAALENLAVIFLKYMSHYLLELSKIDVKNLQIQHEIVNILASMTALNEFSENEFYMIVRKGYFILEEVKKTYNDVTLLSGAEPEFLEGFPDFSKNTTLSGAIRLGEKNSIITSKEIELNRFVTILLVALQSISLNLIDYANL